MRFQRLLFSAPSSPRVGPGFESPPLCNCAEKCAGAGLRVQSQGEDSWEAGVARCLSRVFRAPLARGTLLTRR